MECRENITDFPLVSVIIPNYNGERVIEDCLKSVWSSDYPHFEVVVIDDFSTDNTIEVVKSLFPATKIIKNDRNMGFSHSVNRGIAFSKGEIIALLNMDTFVKRNWLSELVKEMLSDEKIGIVGSKVLSREGNIIQYAGGIIGENGISYHIGKGEVDVGQYDVAKEIDYACGAAMGIRRDLINQIGWLDESYSPLYYEDTDLAFRAKDNGYKVIYCPQSVAMHLENYSTDGLTAKFYFYYHRNRIKFFLKYYRKKFSFKNFFKREFQWWKEIRGYEDFTLIRKEVVKAYMYNFPQIVSTILKLGFTYT